MSNIERESIIIDWFWHWLYSLACKRFCPTIDIRQRLTLFQYPSDNWPNIHILTSALQIIRFDNLSQYQEWFDTRKSKLARLWYCLLTHYGTGNSKSFQLWGFRTPELPPPWLLHWSLVVHPWYQCCWDIVQVSVLFSDAPRKHCRHQCCIAQVMRQRFVNNVNKQY